MVEADLCHGCFLHILRFLHLINNEDATVDKTVCTCKVQKVLNYLCKRFREVCELCIDETMVKFKGRLSIKQYIKIKPVKWGIKLFTLAESATGYVLNRIPYTGKLAETDVTKTTHTVLGVAHDYLYLGHHSFMDNYYMSIELVSSLSGKVTLRWGTMNKPVQHSSARNASRDLQPLATVAATKQVIENGGTQHRG